MDQFTGRIDGVRRELGTLVEGQQDQIRLIAEGHGVLLELWMGALQEMEQVARALALIRSSPVGRMPNCWTS